MPVANGFGRTHGHDGEFAASSLPYRSSGQSSSDSGQISPGVSSRARCMRNEIIKIIQRVTVTLESEIERLYDGILSTEAHSRKMSFTARFATLSPAGNNGCDIQSVFQREL